MVLEENYDTDDLLVRQVSEVSLDPAVASARVELKHRRYLIEFYRSAGNVSEISIQVALLQQDLVSTSGACTARQYRLFTGPGHR